MTKEEEIGGKHPEGEKCQPPLKAGRGKKHTPWGLRKEPALLTPWF